MNFEVSFYPVLFYPRPLSSLPIILLLFYHLSRILQWVSVLPLSLHSTMFLLIQKQKKKNRKNIQHFTFHNVSINTSRLKASKGEDTIFTFHNVSINTNLPQSLTLILACFTFHNVSINTIMRCIKVGFMEISLHSTMFLLIPNLSELCHAILFALHSTMFLLIRQSHSRPLPGSCLYIPQCFY